MVCSCLASFSHSCQSSKGQGRSNEGGTEIVTTDTIRARYTLFANMTNRGQNNFFSENEMNVLLYTVRCSPSIFAWQTIFFSTKKYFVFVAETATPAQILRTEYGEKPVHKTWRTPFIHYLHYVVFSSFRPYFAVVRE